MNFKNTILILVYVFFISHLFHIRKKFVLKKYKRSCTYYFKFVSKTIKKILHIKIVILRIMLLLYLSFSLLQ
jgi:hypothetical protein